MHLWRSFTVSKAMKYVSTYIKCSCYMYSSCIRLVSASLVTPAGATCVFGYIHV